MPLAVGLALTSSLLYILGYGTAKTLVAEHGADVIQLAFLRSALVLGAALVALPWLKGRTSLGRILRPELPWQQRAAGAALVLANILAIVAYSMMPVTTASSLGFVTPLLLTLGSALVLREAVPAMRWLGTLCGIAGMLLILRPTESPALLGVLASIAASSSYACYQILVRRLRDVSTTLDTALQIALVGTVLLAPAMPWFWRELSAAAWVTVLIYTAMQTVALACMAGALRMLEASRLAPWQFSGLLWAMLIDAVMFQNLPAALSLVGAAMIIGGGLLAMWAKPKAAA